MIRKLMLILFIAFASLLFVGCGGDEPKPDDPPVDPPVVEDVKVNKIEVDGLPRSLKVGEEFDLKNATVTVTPANATNKEVEWSSYDSSIIKVENGKLIALKEGIVMIEAAAKDGSLISTSVTIRVEANLVPELIAPEQVVLRVGMTGEIESSTNTGNPITFTIDKKDVVTLNGNVITGLKEGSATITAKCGDLQKIIKVTVLANTFQISGASSIVAGNKLQLKALLNDEETTATWQSNEPNIATIDANGLVTAIAEGSVIIKAKSPFGEEAQVTITIEANTVKPTSITLASNAPEVIYVDTEIKLDYDVAPSGASRDVIWTTSDDRTAKVDKNGNVRFYKGGSVVITCTSKLRKGTTTSITLTSLDYVDPMAFFVKYSVGEVANEWLENYAWNLDPNPYTLLRGSISYYWFEEFTVITTKAYEGVYGQSSGNYCYGPRTNTWYITVHDSGGNSSGLSLANYAAGSAQKEEKSWHYSVGSDGIYKGLNEDMAGWHAGDGNRPVEWTDTKVEADPFNQHANVTISSDQYWVINGVKTDILVRPTNYGADSVPKTFSNNDLPMTGINTRIGSNGTYLIGSTWWSKSYKTLSNCGGNANSIGMESEVGEESELEVTWHHIAQLCADIIVRRNLALGLDAILQHNTFSGKNCPQTMREGGRWPYFKKMCEAEYIAKKYLYEFNFELICSSPLIDANGQVIKFPAEATEITYQVRVTSTVYNYDKTTDPIKVVIPAAIAKTH